MATRATFWGHIGRKGINKRSQLSRGPVSGQDPGRLFSFSLQQNTIRQDSALYCPSYIGLETAAVVFCSCQLDVSLCQKGKDLPGRLTCQSFKLL